MCKSDKCEEIIDPARVALGYRTCIFCGSPPKKFTVAIASNKGSYQVIPESEIPCIGRR